jgi:hypothetical protein
MPITDYEIHSTKYLKEIKQIQEIERKKRKLETDIVNLIRVFEDETGVAIDIIKYERDITIPLKHEHYYTDLKIVVTSDRQD